MTTTAHKGGHAGGHETYRLTPLAVAGIALGLWGLFLPQPLWLCVVVLAVTPPACIGIALASGGAVSLNDRRGKRLRPSVGAAFLMACLALGARGLKDVMLVDWRPPLFAAAALAVAFTAAALAAEREFRRAIFVPILLLFGLSWGWGLAVEANAFLDRGGWTTYRAPVLDKHIRRSRGRGGGTNEYYVTVGPNAVPGITDQLRVGRTLYYATEVGQTVCAQVAPGRFGWPWYEVKACS